MNPHTFGLAHDPAAFWIREAVRRVIWRAINRILTALEDEGEEATCYDDDTDSYSVH